MEQNTPTTKNRSNSTTNKPAFLDGLAEKIGEKMGSLRIKKKKETEKKDDFVISEPSGFVHKESGNTERQKEISNSKETTQLITTVSPQPQIKTKPRPPKKELPLTPEEENEFQTTVPQVPITYHRDYKKRNSTTTPQQTSSFFLK